MQLILTLLHQLGLQIVIIFGNFLVLGFILSKLQEATNCNYQKLFGWKGILFTAWLGTPIHEFSHFIMAKLFRHKIHELSLFRPNKRTGGLGHVDHSFNPRSIYQRIGNFFIGAAPLLVGSALLTLLAWGVLPSGPPLLQTLTDSSLPIIERLQTSFIGLFNTTNLRHWSFWLFLYVSFCIASHLAPSKQDRENMWRGFAWIILLLIIFNAAALLIKKDTTVIVWRVAPYLQGLTVSLLYASMILGVQYVVTTLLVGLKKLI